MLTNALVKAPTVLPRQEEVTVLHTRVVTESGGGPDKTILNSPRFMQGSGYRLLCAFMHPPDDPGIEQLKKRAAALGAPFYSIFDRGPLDWRVATQLLRLCRQERVHIWHGHDYKSNLLGILLRSFWPMRLVTTVHGWVKHVPPRTTIYYFLDRLILRTYERIICVSPDLHAECLKWRVPTTKCSMIPNAIDLAAYTRRYPTAEAKRRLGLAPEETLIGAVGRLSEEKGFDELIDAVQQLRQRGSPASLVILGEGSFRRDLEALIAQLGCRDYVRLAGFQPETRLYYEAMDIFALSSHREGMPNVVLEAMALGVPVVATRIAGVPLLVQHDQTGLLVEPGHVEQLVPALERLVCDPALRNRLAQAAYHAVEKSFSFEVRMKRVRAVYDELLGTRLPQKNGTALGYPPHSC
jgi:glycosyltransferase involved in cell wall biosynthesis